MAVTQFTNVLTVRAIYDVVGPDGLRYKQICCDIKSNETFTTAIAGVANTSVGAVLNHTNRNWVGTDASSTVTRHGAPQITFTMLASGGGTLPAVGDSINVVVG